MSKWLSVCIFLLLAIACTVDVEPAEPAAPIASAEPNALAGQAALAEADARTAPAARVTPITQSRPATPATVAWDEHANRVSHPGATGDPSRVFVTRGWSQSALHASAP